MKKKSDLVREITYILNKYTVKEYQKSWLASDLAEYIKKDRVELISELKLSENYYFIMQDGIKQSQYHNQRCDKLIKENTVSE